MTQTIPVLAGPTASGKSALALNFAETFPLEIISADAMMVYRGMDIGTAKPTREERARVLHHLIDVVNPYEPFNVADFVRLAEQAVNEVLARGALPLVVGGTGFYIRALSEGLPTVPSADPARQAELWEIFEREGLEPLQRELHAFSPEDARRAQRNPRRVGAGARDHPASPTAHRAVSGGRHPALLTTNGSCCRLWGCSSRASKRAPRGCFNRVWWTR